MGKFSNLDMYLFGQGTHYDIYKKLGAHADSENGIKGIRFRSGHRMQIRFLLLVNSTTGMKAQMKWSG